MSFSYRERTENISEINQETFDLVIVGGGITGAGIARDASSRGMKVALVEAKDFAGGTSSRSSKLIHGGIRYLENMEFHLVFEALAERALLFKMAPHLVHPLRFIIPIYKNSRVGYWKMLAGMWLYDLLALFETPQMHESLDSTELRSRIESIEARELLGGVEYSDAYMDDDRLVIETLRDANRKGAKITNYTTVVAAELGGDQEVEALVVSDSITHQKFKVKGRQYVFGVGPWTDIFGKAINPQWKRKLRPTKGVHLVFSKNTIPIEKAVVMAVEKRIIFVIPRHEMVIVGTTDTDFAGDPLDVSTNIADVDYILSALNKYFPHLKIDYHHILSSYCGVRPLVEDGAENEGKTSREHSIFDFGPNATFIAGGKYTTYRKISEEAVDYILRKMSFEQRMVFGASNTKHPLNPLITQGLYNRARLSVNDLAIQYGLDPKLVSQLVERHGAEAEDVLQIIKSKFHIYSPNEALWMGEAAFAIEQTMCMNLVDFYWRRSPLFLAARKHGLKYLAPITKVFNDYYKWSPEDVEKNQQQLLDQMQKELAWKANTLDVTEDSEL